MNFFKIKIQIGGWSSKSRIDIDSEGYRISFSTDCWYCSLWW